MAPDTKPEKANVSGTVYAGGLRYAISQRPYEPSTHNLTMQDVYDHFDKVEAKRTRWRTEVNAAQRPGVSPWEDGRKPIKKRR